MMALRCGVMGVRCWVMGVRCWVMALRCWLLALRNRQLAVALCLLTFGYQLPANTQHLSPNTHHPTPNTQHPTPNTQHLPPNTQKQLPELLSEIDQAIELWPQYVQQYENRITEARRKYELASNDRQHYEAAYALYDLYRPFVNDSAMHFLKECITLSKKAGRHSDVARCQALLAWRCSSTGMYDEALAVLDSIRTDGIDQAALGEYAHAYNNVYNEMAYYTQMPEMKQAYSQRAADYQELMYRTLPDNDPRILLRHEMTHLNGGEVDKSLPINDRWLKQVQPGSHPYAMVALYRYLEYKARGDEQLMMYWLVESVLADIRNGVMDQGSMWELANQLMLKGDVERANRYISYTSDCAIRYGSRQRNWQIAPLLTQIAKTYKEKSDRTTSQLRVLLAALSVLALVLLGVLLFLNRRNKQLAAARNELRNTNSQLTASNAQLSTLNAQLSTLNAQLSQLNAQLSEANQVKEEYIGRFLSLCSQYIDKLDNYRKTVNKKMKNKELDELYRMTKSTELKEKEIEELYQNFDSVFLHLFPNFVDDFNSLLVPDMQVHPKEDNKLTTDIRIFALIRLGIDDSSKIAEFLHYSVNTIYNYRARIKNGAVGNREAFERQVKKLGLPRQT